MGEGLQEEVALELSPEDKRTRKRYGAFKRTSQVTGPKVGAYLASSNVAAVWCSCVGRRGPAEFWRPW